MRGQNPVITSCLGGWDKLYGGHEVRKTYLNLHNRGLSAFEISPLPPKKDIWKVPGIDSSAAEGKAFHAALTLDDAPTEICCIGMEREKPLFQIFSETPVIPVLLWEDVFLLQKNPPPLHKKNPKTLNNGCWVSPAKLTQPLVTDAFLTCPLWSASSARILVLQRSRGHQFST